MLDQGKIKVIPLRELEDENITEECITQDNMSEANITNKIHIDEQRCKVVTSSRHIIRNLVIYDEDSMRWIPSGNSKETPALDENISNDSGAIKPSGNNCKNGIIENIENNNNFETPPSTTTIHEKIQKFRRALSEKRQLKRCVAATKDDIDEMVEEEEDVCGTNDEIQQSFTRGNNNKKKRSKKEKQRVDNGDDNEQELTLTTYNRNV